MRRRDIGSYFVGDKGCPSVGSALSYAQNLASAWKDVRGPLGDGLYRVDKDADGIVRTYEIQA
jgi:hypothetical protein